MLKANMLNCWITLPFWASKDLRRKRKAIKNQQHVWTGMNNSRGWHFYSPLAGRKISTTVRGELPDPFRALTAQKETASESLTLKFTSAQVVHNDILLNGHEMVGTGTVVINPALHETVTTKSHTKWAISPNSRAFEHFKFLMSLLSSHPRAIRKLCYPHFTSGDLKHRERK